MRNGKRDRYIKIEKCTATFDNAGQEVQTWSTYAILIAEWKPMLANDRFKAQGIHSVNAGKLIVKYYQGIDSKMRVVFNERIFRIVGVADIGRNEAIEIAIEEWL